MKKSENRSGVFTVNFKHIPHHFLVILLLLWTEKCFLDSKAFQLKLLLYEASSPFARNQSIVRVACLVEIKCVVFFLFCLDLELFAKIKKNPDFCTLVFYTFINKSRSKQNEKNPIHAFVDITK